MAELALETADGRTQFAPGETMEVTAIWEHDQHPESVELRLVWYTRGKGDQDVGVVETFHYELPGISGSWRQSLTLPPAPYSFSGKLISLIWAIELLVEPGGASTRLDIVVAPEGREVLLQEHESSR